MAKRDQERKRIWEDRNSERKSKIWCQKVNEREKTKMVIITRQQEHEGRREKQLESKEERTDGMQVLRRSFFWKTTGSHAETVHLFLIPAFMS